MKKALMFAGNFWHTPKQVGTHAIARSLLKLGYEVGFVSKPISPIHILGGFNDELKARFHLWQKGGEWVEDGKLWTYLPLSLMTPYNKPLLSSRYVYEHWQDYAVPSLPGKIREAGFDDVDILYLDNPVLAKMLEYVKYKKTIFRITDLNKGFHDLSPINTEKERSTLSKVDYVIYSARQLESELVGLELKNEPIYFPNGVDYDKFQRECERPVAYAELDGPIAIYVGCIAEWFDYDIVKHMAKERPDVNFVIIGAMDKAKAGFEGIDNIYALGARAHNEIVSYLRYADVGIIPFDRNYNPEFVDAINPLKLYEYMACGLPVVSQEWNELTRLNTPAYLYSSYDEALACLDKALAEQGSRREEYRAYAASQRWIDKVERLIDRLGI